MKLYRGLWQQLVHYLRMCCSMSFLEGNENMLYFGQNFVDVTDEFYE